MHTSTALSGPSSKPQQLLLRLPDDLSQRFAQLVPQRQRSRFLLDLLRSALDKESLALSQAAQTLTSLEQGQVEAHAEATAWLDCSAASVDDDAFDAVLFERECAQAQQTTATP
jgi:predicted transcriptional regulator